MLVLSPFAPPARAGLDVDWSPGPSESGSPDWTVSMGLSRGRYWIGKERWMEGGELGAPTEVACLVSGPDSEPESATAERCQDPGAVSVSCSRNRERHRP